MRKILYILIISVLFSGGGLLFVKNYLSSGNNLDKPVTLLFASGLPFSDIVDKLAEEKVISYPDIFKIAVFISGESTKFKSGEYLFQPRMSPNEVTAMIVGGKTVIHRLSVAEGLTTTEILELIKNNDALSGEITLDPKEGDLLPETYNFSRGDKRNDMISRMQHAMKKALNEAWENRAEKLPYKDKAQALVMASIVEKETGVASERTRIAGVYVNRLRKDMLLQADPTTAYAITLGKYKLDRPLNYKDLASDSPFNTYRSKGLPPTPIANPGKAAIIATLHPLASDELFFVATGNGGHNFAATLAEHNENVRKYRNAVAR